MKDSLGNEKAFHHARINKINGISSLAIYMDAIAVLGIFHLSNSDYSVPNQIWSCGYYNDPNNLSMKTAIYSVATTSSSSASLIIGSEKSGLSICYGIRGISSNSAYVVRILSSKYYITQISYIGGTGGSPMFSSMSYDMNGKIISKISFSKAVFK